MKKLYVGNLSYQADEQALQDWFADAGFQVDSVTIIRDRFSHQPRGFGFVEISNSDEADRAIADLNGKEFLGRNLVINEARPQRERFGGGGGGRGERRPGGGGGGRGRGGGGGGRYR